MVHKPHVLLAGLIALLLGNSSMAKAQDSDVEYGKSLDNGLQLEKQRHLAAVAAIVWWPKRRMLPAKLTTPALSKLYGSEGALYAGTVEPCVSLSVATACSTNRSKSYCSGFPSKAA